MSSKPPCPGCPWRVDQGAEGVPGFSLEMAEELVTTTDDQLGAPMMACHHSKEGDEIICRGWLVTHGWDNIAVRLKMLNGTLSPGDLEPGDDWPELHANFDEFITKLRGDSMTDDHADEMQAPDTREAARQVAIGVKTLRDNGPLGEYERDVLERVVHEYVPIIKSKEGWA